MAVRNATVTNIGKGVVKVEWTGLLNTDTGRPEDLTRFPNRAIQVKGTFGAGGTVVIEGSIDGGTTYAQINDSRGEGNALSFTAADLRKMLENPLAVRPNVTGGDGTTSLTVSITASRRD